MATLGGSLFEENSTLSEQERTRAVECLGEDVSFENAFGPGGPLIGTAQNDVFYVKSSYTPIFDQGGTDIAISSTSYKLNSKVEHLILTGEDDYNAVGIGNYNDNVIAGSDGDNYIDGRAGDDGLFGGLGDDTLKGGIGNDKLFGGEGNDSLCGGIGDDTIQGNTGNDYLRGALGDDLLLGGNGDDLLRGDRGSDTMYGGTGNDTLLGGLGNDSAYGGDGDDFVFGGIGNDTVAGGDNADTVSGGLGNDTIFGGEDDDLLYGGFGDDVFVFEDHSGEDAILDFDNGDELWVQNDVNGSGFMTSQDVLDNLTDNLDGDVVVNLGNGNNVTLVGVDSDDLDTDDIVII